MSPTGVVLLVVAILAVNAVIWVALSLWLRGRLRRAEAELRRRVQGDERFVVEPSVGNYRGASDRFGKVKGAGVLALTDRRLMCAKAIGATIDVPIAEVVELREDKWFLGAYNGLPHLILKLRDGVEVGVQVRDHARWMEHLRAGLASRG